MASQPGQNVMRFLTFDEKNTNSILSCLRSARENARTVREMMSSQMWEELNKFYLMVRSAREAEVYEQPYDFFNRLKNSGHCWKGWPRRPCRAARPGTSADWRDSERADKTSRILDVKYYLLLPSVADVGTPLDSNQWARC